IWQAKERADLASEQARSNEKKAQESEVETKAVLEFVVDRVFAAARPEGEDGGLGHDVSLRRAIEAALPFVEKSFSAQPLIEARLRETLGVSFSDLGDAKTALEQHQVARALYAKHLGPDHPDTLKSMHGLAGSLFDLGRYTEAAELFEKT